MNTEYKTSLDIETVRRIAQLSRLGLSSEEEILFQKELEKVLNAFHALTQAPLEVQEDSRSAFLFEEVIEKNAHPDEALSHMAKDIPHNSVSTKNFISQSPEHEGLFVRVPLILNQEH